MFELTKAALVAALAGCWCAVTVPSARAADPTDGELNDRVSRLESELSSVKGELKTRAEVRSTQAAVQTDAANRSEMFNLESIAVRYHDGQLQITNPDGTLLMHPFFHLQFRNVFNYRDDAKHNFTESDAQNGFEVRRMEFGVDGHAFGQNLTYLFLWDTDRHNGRPILEEAWVRYRFANGPWAIKAGQIKDPFDHEQLTSSAQFVPVERTLTVDVLAAGDAFSHGVQAMYDDGGPFRAAVAFTDGIGSANQTFQDFPTNLANWGVAGRAEYKFYGDWDRYSDASARGNKSDLLVVGAGVDYTEAGSMAAFRHVIDAQYETNKLGLYGAYLGRFTRNNTAGGGPKADDTYDWSIRAQAAYAWDLHWEPFLRYDWMHLDKGGIPTGFSGSVHEITGGVNYYFFGQQAKFTFDVTYLPNGSPVNDDGSGVLMSKGGQWLVRGQFQLVL
jgi:hypothetical protein